MSKIYVSYRHVSPDQELAHFLASYCQQRTHAVFVDTQMHVGTRWPDEIERQIRAAQFFIVLLSKDSIRSDMVRR